MRKFFSKFFKKKSKFTGFEVKLWKDGKLLNHAVGHPEQIMTYTFPCSSFLETSKGVYLQGYNLVPHLERI